MRKMRTVTAKAGELIHVETPLGIVNIHTGLTDAEGQRVETVEMLPNQYAGEPLVTVDGYRFIEKAEKGASCEASDMATCVICGKFLRVGRVYLDTCGEKCYRRLLTQQRSAFVVMDERGQA